jgi:hypothetical protein
MLGSGRGAVEVGTGQQTDLTLPVTCLEVASMIGVAEAVEMEVGTIQAIGLMFDQ